MPYWQTINLKTAIISDIHGNLEALQAVLADIERTGISRIFCLGDIIGYGPNPCQCVDLAMQFEWCILGNHDSAALFDPEGFSSGAERAIFWTRKQLESANGDAKNTRRWEFLCELPRIQWDNGILFVHGSARNPLNEYVFPEDIYNSRKMSRIFSLIPQYCFQGHTHVPGIHTAEGRFHSPVDVGYRFRLPKQKSMINVGSVGQPRDADWRSSYVVLDDGWVEFRRVEYPVDVTIQKIYSTPELDKFLGDRLREGR